MATITCSNCNASYDKDYWDGLDYEGDECIIFICNNCEPGYEFWMNTCDSMQRRIDHEAKQREKYVSKSANAMVEIESIVDAGEQALKRINRL